MKKILFSLVALVCSMSMNAQIMKVMKNGVEVATYKGPDYTVVFEEEPPVKTTGTAKRTGNIDVKWVQLWENGPKFAEYNVGAASNKAEDYGGYYLWGSSIDKAAHTEYKDGDDPLTCSDDTATNLWGSNWRMPTGAELQALLDNCDVEWTTVNGVGGCMFTGKWYYSNNSVFLPAAGSCNHGEISNQDYSGMFWSSTPSNSILASFLNFSEYQQRMSNYGRYYGLSVRAVLAEE